MEWCMPLRSCSSVHMGEKQNKGTTLIRHMRLERMQMSCCVWLVTGVVALYVRTILCWEGPKSDRTIHRTQSHYVTKDRLQNHPQIIMDELESVPQEQAGWTTASKLSSSCPDLILIYDIGPTPAKKGVLVYIGLHLKTSDKIIVSIKISPPCYPAGISNCGSHSNTAAVSLQVQCHPVTSLHAASLRLHATK